MSFDVIDDTIIVPTDPEGHIELRLIGDTVFIQRWVFVREPFAPGRSELIASMRVPTDALRAVLGEVST